ncbi:hypothetical protein I551_1523, partial [Mycobacterium ulcerans str. Harvey]
TPVCATRAAQDMGVTTEGMAAWRDAADAVNIPYDEELAYTAV